MKTSFGGAGAASPSCPELPYRSGDVADFLGIEVPPVETTARPKEAATPEARRSPCYGAYGHTITVADGRLFETRGISATGVDLPNGS